MVREVDQAFEGRAVTEPSSVLDQTCNSHVDAIEVLNHSSAMTTETTSPTTSLATKTAVTAAPTSSTPNSSCSTIV